MKKLLVCLLVLGAAKAHRLAACIWDQDTIAAEVARFPGVAEVMTGQFPRHSREFYEWRRKTCEASLARDPSQVNLYDDLAVAQHKLGDHKAAIATMMKKDKVSPDLYETCSNLGTFYIYTGELDSAVKWIQKALAINPRAHFGREKYQLWLVQWVQKRSSNNEGLNPREQIEGVPMGFARFIAVMQAGPETITKSEAKIVLNNAQKREAITGVLGMMRFADFDNPLLQEALGDLLVTGGLKENAAQLASMAYLGASDKTEDPNEKKRLMDRSKRALMLSMDAKDYVYGGRNTPFERQLNNGLAKGQALAYSIRMDELSWIEAGMDASAEFQKKYLAPR